MKKQSKLLILILTLAMVFSVLGAFAITSSAAEDGTWTLVTDVSNLAAGDQIVIVAKDYNYALSTTQNSNNRGQASVTKSGDTVTFGNGVQGLTLENGTTSGTFAFYTDSGYLYAASSSSNYLRTETKLSANSSWKITIAANGTATVVAQGTYTRNTMQYNQSSSLFACYNSASQKAICIYKYVESSSGGETDCTHENTTTTTVDATCTNAGKSTVVCDDCGETISTETINALGHDYNENHVCTVCYANEPKAIFMVNGEEVGDPVYGETITLPGCDENVSGFNRYTYQFAGWATSAIEEGVTNTTFKSEGDEVKLTSEENTFYAVFSYSATGATPIYQKVTSSPADWTGQYLIVYEGGKVAFNGGLTTLDAVSNTISITISNGKIEATNETNAAAFTIDANGYIKSASGYYIGQTSDANGLVSNKTTNYTNTLSINANGTVNIVSGGAYLRYNATSGQTRFRYYKSSSYTGQKAICLYELTEENGTFTYYTTKLEVSEHVHSYEEVETNPTCTEGGYTTYTCGCGDSYVSDYIDALGHSLGDWNEEVSATCIATGTVIYQHCSNCEKNFDINREEIADTTIAIDPYAHNDAYKESGVCTDCGLCYSYVFGSKQFKENSTIKFGNVNWSLEGDGNYWGYSSEKGQQFGSGNAPYTNMTLTLTGFENITKIVINTSGASGIAGSFTVTVGKNEVGSGKLEKEAKDYEFSFDAASGAIVIYYEQTSKVAIYIESIRVYGEGLCDHSDCEITNTATCTNGGIQTTTCKSCGNVETENVDFLGHKDDDKDHKCDVCKETFTNHDYSDDGKCECGDAIKAQVGDKYYDDFTVALKAANDAAKADQNNPPEQTITIYGDIEVAEVDGGELSINGGITLNLNGNNITADRVVLFGNAVITGNGIIYVPKDNFAYSTVETTYIPVWNEENGYQFVEFKDQYKQAEIKDENGEVDTSKVAIDFRPAIVDADENAKHFDLFGDEGHDITDEEGNVTGYSGGAANNGITFEVRIYSEDGSFDKTYTIPAELIQKVYANKTSIRITLVNAEENVVYNLQLIIRSDVGMYRVSSMGSIKNGELLTVAQ